MSQWPDARRRTTPLVSCLPRQLAKLIGPKILTRTMTDVENPNHLALLVYFIEDSVNMPPLAEQETTNLSFCFLGFTRQRATGRELF